MDLTGKKNVAILVILDHIRLIYDQFKVISFLSSVYNLMLPLLVPAIVMYSCSFKRKQYFIRLRKHLQDFSLSC